MDARGYVFIEDRKKDMINVSGFNVYPNEVEAAVASHPGVLEAAAVAQSDEHSGEAVAVFVVRKDSLTDGKRDHRTQPQIAHGLQGPEARLLQERVAEDECGEDPKKDLER